LKTADTTKLNLYTWKW